MNKYCIQLPVNAWLVQGYDERPLPMAQHIDFQIEAESMPDALTRLQDLLGAAIAAAAATQVVPAPAEG